MAYQFKGLYITEEQGEFKANLTELSTADLPNNEVLIKVAFSSVNYKDVLSASGNKGVTQKFPHVPGIDAAGEVVSSRSNKFKTGDKVIVTGYDLGMNTWGGFGEYISVPSGWVLSLPEPFSLLDAMALGTAGLTAGLSIYELINSGVTPEKGKIAVSGATGGVGSISVAILSKLGYEVVAISGKKQNDFLTRTLGANAVFTRQDFIDKYDKDIMSKMELAGGIDAVGGRILSGMLKATNYNGTVTCCGLVASPNIETTIYPFIIRNVRLVGIDSVEQPLNHKEAIWKLLANEWKPTVLSHITKLINLEELPAALYDVSQGNAIGRYVVSHG